MNKFLYKALIIWACVLVALVVWVGFARGVTEGRLDRWQDRRETYATQLHFWNVVAGRDNPRPGVLDKLARDLNQMTVDEIRRLRGDSNRYGGITEELGYDPFDGVNCNECGPLKQTFIRDVITAKNGNPDVAAGFKPPRPADAAGPPWLLWLLWLLGAPTIYIVALRRRERRYRMMPYEARLVRELDDAMKELPQQTDDYSELLSLRKRLQKAMDERIRYGEDEKNDLRRKELMRDAQDSLASITEGNRTLHE